MFSNQEQENNKNKLIDDFNKGLMNLELERQKQGINVDATIAKEIKKAEIKLQTEMLLMDLREEAELKKETQNLQVIRNHENRLCLEVVRNQKGNNFRKIIVREEFLASKIFYCNWPIPMEVLTANFKVNGENVDVCMMLTHSDKDVKDFVTRAEAVGIHFLISGKLKLEAQKSVFQYVVAHAQKEFRAYKRGFQKGEDCWIFTEDRDLTMEVIMNG